MGRPTMETIPKKPAGSTIEERDEIEGRTLFWKLPDGGMARYYPIVFFSLWLCGWAVGEWFAIHAIVTNKFGGFDTLFMGVWVAGWTFG